MISGVKFFVPLEMEGLLIEWKIHEDRNRHNSWTMLIK